MSLLSLLYQCSKYSPQQWSTYDNFLLDKQWDIGAFATSYNPGAISLGSYGLKYGTWTPWEERKAHGGMILGFPRGILLLEAQTKPLQFLRSAVGKLLEGIARQDSDSQSARFLKLFEHDPTSPIKNDFSARQLSSAFLNQPFSAPPLFDITAFCSIGTLQLDLVGDHLTFLQTEPKYMRNYIIQVLKGGTDDSRWQENKSGMIAQWVFQDAARFLLWERICEETRGLHNIYNLYHDDISPGKPMPVPYEDSLTVLNELLLEEAKWRASFIERALPTRPAFRQHHKVHWIQSQGQAICVTKRSDTTSSYVKTFFTDRLEFCLRILIQDSWHNPWTYTQDDTSRGTARRFDPSTIFAMLDQHLTECHKNGLKDELSRLDQVLYVLYSELSAIFQMLSMLQLHQPTFPELFVNQIKEKQLGKAWNYLQEG
ncbi:hypothetical protein BKA65DRAFT_476563 [Rhexocercosporidium sp. MPI-PUGE-AT-0058]|nr:hypothetical protein BKA65DRAFT_476563 [Rhexocercosporidium sp. MPI-PUGE-AT-0058]